MKQSLQRNFRRPCTQICEPPHSSLCAFRRSCAQKSLPPHSRHLPGKGGTYYLQETVNQSRETEHSPGQTLHKPAPEFAMLTAAPGFVLAAEGRVLASSSQGPACCKGLRCSSWFSRSLGRQDQMRAKAHDKGNCHHLCRRACSSVRSRAIGLTCALSPPLS